MKIFSKIKEDLVLHDKGAPFKLKEILECIEDPIIYVRRMDYKFYDFLNEVKKDIHGFAYTEDALSSEEKIEAEMIAISEYLVARFTGFIDEETGKEIKYNLSTSKAIFADREHYLGLTKWVKGFSQNMDNYLKKELVKDAEAVKKP